MIENLVSTSFAFLIGVMVGFFGLLASRGRDIYKENKFHRGTLSYFFAKFWGFVDKVLFFPISSPRNTIDIRDYDLTVVKGPGRITHIVTYYPTISTISYALIVISPFSLSFIFALLFIGYTNIFVGVISVFFLVLAVMVTAFTETVFKDSLLIRNFQCDKKILIWNPNYLSLGEGFTELSCIKDLSLVDGYSFVKWPLLSRVQFPSRRIVLNKVDGSIEHIFSIPSFINDRFGGPADKLFLELSKTIEHMKEP